jgi:hypothetical protein
MTIKTLVIFRDECKQRKFFDWIISHTSGFLPPHRYKGEIEITDQCIKFFGLDTQLKTESEFLIERNRIEEIYFGYDEIFNVYQTRGLGLGWAPVRIKFIEPDGQEKYAYFITGYDTWGSVNKDFYSFLMEWLS